MDGNKMEIDDIKTILRRWKWLSPMHDYIDSGDCIRRLGVYEEELGELRQLISDDWVFVERRRNAENNFMEIDIVKEGQIK